MASRLCSVGRIVRQRSTQLRTRQFSAQAAVHQTNNHVNNQTINHVNHSAATSTTHTVNSIDNANVEGSFLGARTTFTTNCALNLPGDFPVIPTVRLMDPTGKIIAKDFECPFETEELLSIYKTMIYVHLMDGIFYDAQRQGRISFYMTNFGEEALQVGSISACKSDDVIFGQYREAGVFMHRGFPLQQFAHQCFSNAHDLGKGRQMPVHYGSKEHNIQTISSPLGTQLPQAAGAAYALKREGKGRIAICYFGEGAASEGDFHPALNMSATLDCPVIFFCRNNGYAISTPTHEQYRGDGIASRAAGYGMAVIRVDGNDLFAVHQATRDARAYALKNDKPVLIEAMSYRGGHHSTSDDSTRYRSSDEISHWSENYSPITRIRLYMESKGIWSSDQEAALRKQARVDVLNAMKQAEQSLKPPVDQMFEDVYDVIPPHLQKQKEELMAHLEKYGDKYGLEGFQSNETYENPSHKSL